MLVQSIPPTFTTQTALQAGLSYRALYRMRDAGDVVELSRGVFRFADAPMRRRQRSRIYLPSRTGFRLV